MNDEQIKERLAKIGSQIVKLLTPDELHRYAEAERRLQETQADKVRMLELAKARNPSGWQEKLDPEERAQIQTMPEAWREAATILEAEEMERFAQLPCVETESESQIAVLLRIAAGRA